MATRRKIEWDKMTEEEKWEAAESLGGQDYYLDSLADIISSGKNVSPHLIAKHLRNLYEVNIPCEILEYAADLLEGKRRKGRPVTRIDMSSHEAVALFTQSDFADLMKKGHSADESMRILAKKMIKNDDPAEEEIERIVNRISKWIYPRNREPRGNHSRD